MPADNTDKANVAAACAARPDVLAIVGAALTPFMAARLGAPALAPTMPNSDRPQEQAVRRTSPLLLHRRRIPRSPPCSGNCKPCRIPSDCCISSWRRRAGGQAPLHLPAAGLCVFTPLGFWCRLGGGGP